MSIARQLEALGNTVLECGLGFAKITPSDGGDPFEVYQLRLTLGKPKS